jgi:phosphoglycerate dehydrogenase-like enzyme
MHGLDSGVISGAGLDVFSVEPYTGPLLKYPQVIVTPHVSSNTTESRDQMETDAMDNLLTAIEGVMQ